MKKKKQFYIQGIYHPLSVKLVTKKWLARHVKDKDIMGAYEHLEAKIYIVKDLTPQVKLHTLYHEISHHILDTLETVEEEHRCDLVGSYLMKLVEEKDRIKQGLADD